MTDTTPEREVTIADVEELRPQLARVEADLADARHDAEHCARERDEAVAETARVRAVYRDALGRWRDELTQLRKAVTTIAARRERERPDDIIVDALRAALAGATTTSPQTAPRRVYADDETTFVLPDGLPYVVTGWDRHGEDGEIVTLTLEQRGEPVTDWTVRVAIEKPTPRTPTVAEWGGAS